MEEIIAYQSYEKARHTPNPSDPQHTHTQVMGPGVSQECTFIVPHLEKDIRRHWSGLAHNPTLPRCIGGHSKVTPRSEVNSGATHLGNVQDHNNDQYL